MEIMFVTIIILGIAYAIFKLVELFARRNERMTIIEKMGFGDGIVNLPDLSKLFPTQTQTSWALRLGLLFTGLGLGLGIAVIMKYYMGPFPQMELHQSNNNCEILNIGLMLFFGGLGLVIAYMIEQKNQKKSSV